MYAGRIVEYADVLQIFDHAAHPYTRALLEAVPKVDTSTDRLFAIPGSPATGFTQAAGCSFADRCPMVLDRCHHERPPAMRVARGHLAECWRAEEIYTETAAPLTTPASNSPIRVEPPPDGAASQPAPLLAVDNLQVHFPVERGGVFNRRTIPLKAVDGVTFAILQGQTLSLVGESGCGKTTTARTILDLEQPTAGQVLWRGKDLRKLRDGEVRAYRAAVQAVFQDPYSSMDPRMRVGDFVAEPLVLQPAYSARDRQERVVEVLHQVGLRAEDAQLFPHQFSGGQRQRIAIARALAPSPQVIVLDEPVSSLDVSIRAQIMNLLKDLQDQLGLSYLFIAHHLGTVRYMRHSVGVMYLGRIVELAGSEELFTHPRHPYTQALLSAALPDHPTAQRQEVLLRGEVAAATQVPTGCRLHPRCPFAMPVCAEVEPEWREVTPAHWTACHLY
jgi:oligopeptide/dipeptide ABC transporter ATP-binding protein